MKKNKTKAPKFEVVGSITVDAGIIQIGDPCYEYGKPGAWLDFCDELKGMDELGVHQLPHESTKGNYGECSRAIVVQSGLGDGVYDVEVKRDAVMGIIKEVRIKFF